VHAHVPHAYVARWWVGSAPSFTPTWLLEANRGGVFLTLPCMFLVAACRAACRCLSLLVAACRFLLLSGCHVVGRQCTNMQTVADRYKRDMQTAQREAERIMEHASEENEALNERVEAVINRMTQVETERDTVVASLRQAQAESAEDERAWSAKLRACQEEVEGCTAVGVGGHVCAAPCARAVACRLDPGPRHSHSHGV